MVGVALVTFASIFAAGARATIENAVRDNFKGAFVVTNTDGFSPYSAQVLGAVTKVPGVGAVSGVRFTTGKARGLEVELDCAISSPRPSRSSTRRPSRGAARRDRGARPGGR